MSANADPNQMTGAFSASDVIANFQRIAWAPQQSTKDEIGIDLYIEVRNSLLTACGWVGAQVKGGDSAFSKECEDSDGNLLGWWLDDTEKHFDYWLEHDIPIFVVLHHPETRVSYWVHVTNAAVDKTGKHYKILVPVDQTVDKEHLGQLVEAASSKKTAAKFEGTAWKRPFPEIPPTQMLRYSILVPRLVAPHPNLHTSNPRYEQIIALLIQGRLEDARESLEFEHYPSESEKVNLRFWGWRFVDALWKYVTGDRDIDFAPLKSKDASDVSVAVATIFEACILIEQGRYQQAIDLLSAIKSGLPVVESAWVRVQHARALSEIGETELARADAEEAQALLVSEPDDVTASTIRGAASTLLYQTAEGSDDLESVIADNDATAIWWRRQELAAGASEALKRKFKEWCDESNSGTIYFRDEAYSGMFAFQVQAHLSGSHGLWRSALGLLSQHALMDNHVRHDPCEPLIDLCRAGDDKGTRLATRKLWRSGSIEPLARAGQHVATNPWGATTAEASLVMLQYGGDVLAPEVAKAAGERCLEILEKAPGEQHGPFSEIKWRALETWFWLCFAADPEMHHRAARTLAQIDRAVERTHAVTLMQHNRIQLDLLSEAEIDGLVASAISSDDREFQYAVTAALRDRRPEAFDDLKAKIVAGDEQAFWALPDWRLLSSQEAEQAIQAFAGHPAGPRFGEIGFLTCKFPDVGDWDTVIAAMKELTPRQRTKRGLCERLAVDGTSVPDHVRTRLYALLPQLGANRETSNPLDVSFGGADVWMAAALQLHDEPTLVKLVMRLLAGSASQQVDALPAIGSSTLSEANAILAAHVGDRDPQVRRCAASELAQRAVRFPSDPYVISGLEEAAGSPSAHLPNAVAYGLRAPKAPLAGNFGDLVATLRQHESAMVRLNAAKIEMSTPTEPRT
jgi:hypothetical protein